MINLSMEYEDQRPCYRLVLFERFAERLIQVQSRCRYRDFLSRLYLFGNKRTLPDRVSLDDLLLFEIYYVPNYSRFYLHERIIRKILDQNPIIAEIELYRRRLRQ
jgi:hypothetical protein